MKETEVHCDHIPALGGMAVVAHIPYNVPAKMYHKERNPPMIGHCDQFRFFRLHIFPGLHNPSSHTIGHRFCPQSRILVGTNPLALINRAFHAIEDSAERRGSAGALNMLRSHIDLSLFSLVFHLDVNRVPPALRDMASGSDTILSFDEVIDAFFADDRLRSLLFHETYHFWQALRLPFLYFYGLKCFYNVIKALPQLLPLVAIPEARKGFAIGAVPEFAQISQKRRVSMWPERATIDSEDAPSASDAQVSARISCLDLMEGAATFCEWQTQQDAASRLDIASFRRWCKRNPSYTTAFRLAAEWIQDDSLLMRCFVPLVCGAFHTSDPVRGFVGMLFVLQQFRSDPNFIATMSYPDPRPWSRMINDFLNALKFEAPPDSTRSLIRPEYCRLSMDFWLDHTTYRHPMLSNLALDWNQRVKDAEKPDWRNNEAELVYQPAWTELGVLYDALLRRGPPIMFLVLHQPTGARRVIPYVNFEAIRTEPPVLSNELALLDLFAIHGAVRKIGGISFDPLHRFCYHTGCPEYEPNFCNLYFAIPKSHAECGFPQLMQDFGRLNSELNREEANDDTD